MPEVPPHREHLPTSPRDWLRAPAQLWSWPELRPKNAIPPRPGVYAWFFDELPSPVPVGGCHRVGDWALAYVGIAPRPPTKDGRTSTQNLAKRLRMHFAGGAFGSTLRFSLGCLLSPTLGLEYRRIGRSFGFGREGEAVLSGWMHRHARVVFLVHETPWTEEERCIESVSLPLNLKGNAQHPFHHQLSLLRHNFVARARLLPIIPR